MPPLYVPILKGKEGEYGALAELEPDVRGVTMPLIEIPDVPRDWERDQPAKPLQAHVSAIADRLYKAWGQEPMYLDFPWFVEENLDDGTPAMAWVLDSCSRRELKILPVVNRTSSVGHVEGAAGHHRRSGLGIGLRLFPADFADDVNIEAEILRILEQAQAKVENVDIIVDLNDLKTDPQTALLVLRSIKGEIPFRDRWRRVILAASSFPQDLSEIDAASMRQIPRLEWDLWMKVQKRPDRILRRDVIFADYAIAHPEPREMDPRMMRMSASIRYTTADSWLIVKGRNVRQWGYEQFYELCERLIHHDAYCGAEFSWGDRQIYLCAMRETGTGNATTWRKVATNHHITLVARQLANARGL